MKKFICIILGMISTIAMTQNITGTWNGALKISGTQLRIVFHIEESGDGYTTKMDSPDQGALGIPTDETTFSEGVLIIKKKALGMTYEGKPVAGEEKITGTFKQGALSLPLDLSREEVKKEEKEARPQDPQEFPYEQEEVNFTVPQGGHKMAGTLTYPSDGTFNQVVVLISGSGPQNRNEELGPMNHRPFLVLSDHLTRQGIAVLRYDDRGVAESGGDFQTATSRDFANDAAAAVAYLKSRKDMKGKKVGLMGHSEGGMIAPMVASEQKDVDFIALLAGPGINSLDLMLIQVDKIGKASGTSEKTRKENQRVSKLAFNLVKDHPDASKEELKEKLRTLLESAYEETPEKERKELGDKETFISSQTQTLISPWFRYFLAFEPHDYLSKVSCPVLAVNGELDLQVTPKENLEAIEKSLNEAGNKEVVIKEFKQMNHLFQKATTGAPSEYVQIEETFNEEALVFISDWVLKQK